MRDPFAGMPGTVSSKDPFAGMPGATARAVAKGKDPFAGMPGQVSISSQAFGTPEAVANFAALKADPKGYDRIRQFAEDNDLDPEDPQVAERLQTPLDFSTYTTLNQLRTTGDLDEINKLLPSGRPSGFGMKAALMQYGHAGGLFRRRDTATISRIGAGQEIELSEMPSESTPMGSPGGMPLQGQMIRRYKKVEDMTLAEQDQAVPKSLREVVDGQVPKDQDPIAQAQIRGRLMTEVANAEEMERQKRMRAAKSELKLREEITSGSNGFWNTLSALAGKGMPTVGYGNTFVVGAAAGGALGQFILGAAVSGYDKTSELLTSDINPDTGETDVAGTDYADAALRGTAYGMYESASEIATGHVLGWLFRGFDKRLLRGYAGKAISKVGDKMATGMSKSKLGRGMAAFTRGAQRIGQLSATDNPFIEVFPEEGPQQWVETVFAQRLGDTETAIYARNVLNEQTGQIEQVPIEPGSDEDRTARERFEEAGEASGYSVIGKRQMRVGEKTEKFFGDFFNLENLSELAQGFALQYALTLGLGAAHAVKTREGRQTIERGLLAIGKRSVDGKTVAQGFTSADLVRMSDEQKVEAFEAFYGSKANQDEYGELFKDAGDMLSQAAERARQADTWRREAANMKPDFSVDIAKEVAAGNARVIDEASGISVNVQTLGGDEIGTKFVVTDNDGNLAPLEFSTPEEAQRGAEEMSKFKRARMMDMQGRAENVSRIADVFAPGRKLILVQNDADMERATRAEGDDKFTPGQPALTASSGALIVNVAALDDFEHAVRAVKHETGHSVGQESGLNALLPGKSAKQIAAELQKGGVLPGGLGVQGKFVKLLEERKKAYAAQGIELDDAGAAEEALSRMQEGWEPVFRQKFGDSLVGWLNALETKRTGKPAVETTTKGKVSEARRIAARILHSGKPANVSQVGTPAAWAPRAPMFEGDPLGEGKAPKVEKAPVEPAAQKQVPKAAVETGKKSPENVLREIGRLSDDLMGGNHPGVPSIGLADGTFAGNGKLNMDGEGNVILTRIYSDKEHLGKGWVDVTRDELIDTSLYHGGGNAIPTSGFVDWNTQFTGDKALGERHVAQFRIPAERLFALIKDGKAILGNIGEGEIVLSPAQAKEFLYTVDGKEQAQDPVGVAPVQPVPEQGELASDAETAPPVTPAVPKAHAVQKEPEPQTSVEPKAEEPPVAPAPKAEAQPPKAPPRNDGELFNPPFNLAANPKEEEAARAAIEREAEAKRKAEEKRKLDAAPKLPGLENSEKTPKGVESKPEAKPPKLPAPPAKKEPKFRGTAAEFEKFFESDPDAANALTEEEIEILPDEPVVEQAPKAESDGRPAFVAPKRKYEENDDSYQRRVEKAQEAYKAALAEWEKAQQGEAKPAKNAKAAEFGGKVERATDRGTLYDSDVSISDQTKPGEQVRVTPITESDKADARQRADRYEPGTIIEDATGIRWRVDKSKRGGILLQMLNSNGEDVGGGETVRVYGEWKTGGLNTIARSKVVSVPTAKQPAAPAPSEKAAEAMTEEELYSQRRQLTVDDIRQRFPTIPENVLQRIGRVTIDSASSRIPAHVDRTGNSYDIQAFSDRGLLHEIGHILEGVMPHKLWQEWKEINAKQGVHFGRAVNALREQDSRSEWGEAENLFTAFGLVHKLASGHSLNSAESNALKAAPLIRGFVERHLMSPGYVLSDDGKTYVYKGEPAPAAPAGSPFKWAPEQQIKTVADNIDRLRATDLYRLMSETPPEHRYEMRDYVRKAHPSNQRILDELRKVMEALEKPPAPAPSEKAKAEAAAMPAAHTLTVNPQVLKTRLDKGSFRGPNFYARGEAKLAKLLNSGTSFELRLEDVTDYGGKVVITASGERIELTKGKVRHSSLDYLFGPQESREPTAVMKVPYTRVVNTSDIRRVKPIGPADSGERVLLTNDQVWEYKGIGANKIDNMSRINGWMQVLPPAQPLTPLPSDLARSIADDLAASPEASAKAQAEAQANMTDDQKADPRYMLSSEAEKRALEVQMGVITPETGRPVNPVSIAAVFGKRWDAEFEGVRNPTELAARILALPADVAKNRLASADAIAAYLLGKPGTAFNVGQDYATMGPAMRDAFRVAWNAEQVAEDAEAAGERAQVEYTPMSAYTPDAAKETVAPMAVPVELAGPLQRALTEFKKRHPEGVDSYVAAKMKWTKAELMDGRLDGAQIDAVALSIDKIDAGAGIIIGSQTGAGKGRIMAAVMAYHLKNGRIPIFMTAKVNLFTAIWRDITAIHEEGLFNQLVFNDYAAPTDSEEDDDSSSMPQSFAPVTKRAAIADKKLPSSANAVFLTYSQLANAQHTTTQNKIALIEALLNSGRGALVLDEAHLAAGADSNTGLVLRHMADLNPRVGVVFSSATFAKRGENMTLYKRAGYGQFFNNDDRLMNAVLVAGGVPFQQYLAARLAEGGYYVRHELDFTGIRFEAINTYDTLGTPQEKTALAAKEASIADRYNAVVRTVMRFNAELNRANIGLKDKVANKGAHFLSQLHNTASFIYTALKADTVANAAVAELRAGRAPVITLYNTNESLLTQIGVNNQADVGAYLTALVDKAVSIRLQDGTYASILPTEDGTASPGYDELLRLMRPKKAAGLKLAGELRNSAVAMMQQAKATGEYLRQQNLSASPIDRVREIVKAAGYEFAEITRRGLMVEAGVVKTRKRANADDELRRFNAGVDAEGRPNTVLLLNSAGAAGLSAHASPRFKNKAQRVMFTLQPAWDINDMMQLFGRVNRKDQLSKPIYRLMFTSAAGEQRTAAILMLKLRSLSANTSGVSKAGYGEGADDGLDFMNSFGDQAWWELVAAQHRVAMDAQALGSTRDVRQATLRIQFLPTSDQEQIITAIQQKVAAMQEHARERGTHDLEAYDVGRVPLTGEELRTDGTIRAYKVSIIGRAKILTAGEAEAAAKEWQAANGEMLPKALEKIRSAIDSTERDDLKAAYLGTAGALQKAVAGIGRTFTRKDFSGRDIFFIPMAVWLPEHGLARRVSDWRIKIAVNNLWGVNTMALSIFEDHYRKGAQMSFSQNYNDRLTRKEERVLVTGDVAQAVIGNLIVAADSKRNAGMGQIVRARPAKGEYASFALMMPHGVDVVTAKRIASSRAVPVTSVREIQAGPNDRTWGHLSIDDGRVIVGVAFDPKTGSAREAMFSFRRKTQKDDAGFGGLIQAAGFPELASGRVVNNYVASSFVPVQKADDALAGLAALSPELVGTQIISSDVSDTGAPKYLIREETDAERIPGMTDAELRAYLVSSAGYEEKDVEGMPRRILLGMATDAEHDAYFGPSPKPPVNVFRRRGGKPRYMLGNDVFVADNATVSAPGMIRYMIAAHHGTPYTFEPEPDAPLGRFHKEKVGTGEGAAAYGWGVAYTAQAKGVADEYRKTLAAESPQIGKLASDALARSGGNTSEAIKQLEKWAQVGNGTDDRKAIEYIRSGMRLGNLYHVELAFDNKDTLDWDALLSEQSEKVRKALQSASANDDIGNEGAKLARSFGRMKRGSGSEVYETLVGYFAQNKTGNTETAKQAASEYLASLGIKGIRYADQGSRAYSGLTFRDDAATKRYGRDMALDKASNAMRDSGGNQAQAIKALRRELQSTGSPSVRDAIEALESGAIIPKPKTYNYVVFNESDIKITGRNGEMLSPSQVTGATDQSAPRYMLSDPVTVEEKQRMGMLENLSEQAFPILEHLRTGSKIVLPASRSGSHEGKMRGNYDPYYEELGGFRGFTQAYGPTTWMALFKVAPNEEATGNVDTVASELAGEGVGTGDVGEFWEMLIEELTRSRAQYDAQNSRISQRKSQLAHASEHPSFIGKKDIPKVMGMAIGIVASDLDENEQRHLQTIFEHEGEESARSYILDNYFQSVVGRMEEYYRGEGRDDYAPDNISIENYASRPTQVDAEGTMVEAFRVTHARMEEINATIRNTALQKQNKVSEKDATNYVKAIAKAPGGEEFLRKTAETFIEERRAGTRPTTNMYETAIMLWYQTDLNARERALPAQAAAATEVNDIKTLDSIVLEDDALNGLWVRLVQADFDFGSSAGKALRARQLTVDENFNIVKMYRQAFADNGNIALTPEQFKRLRARLRKLEQAWADYTEAASLPDESADLEKRAAELEAALADLGLKREAIRAEVEGMQKNITRLEAEHAKQGGATAELSEKRAQLQRQIDDLTTEIAFRTSLKQEVASVQKRVDVLTAELAALDAEYASRANPAALEALEKELANLNKLYAAKLRAYERADADLKAAKARVARVREMVKELAKATGGKLERTRKIREHAAQLYGKFKAEMEKAQVDRLKERWVGADMPDELAYWQKVGFHTAKFYKRSGLAISVTRDLVRALQSMGDESVAGRQLFKLALAHPVLFGRAFAQSQALVFHRAGMRDEDGRLLTWQERSDRALFEMDQALKEHPLYDVLVRKGGLSWMDITADPPSFDEQKTPVGPMLNRMLPSKTTRFVTSVLGVSNNHYAGMSNLLRFNVAAQLYGQLNSAKGEELSEEDVQAIVGIVDIFGGRGDLSGKFAKNFNNVAGYIFYSPRLAVANAQFYTRMFGLAFNPHYSARARGMMAMEYLRLAGSYTLLTLLAHMWSRWTSDDPDEQRFQFRPGHPSFLMLMRGQRRLDITGGSALWARAVSNILGVGDKLDTETGMVKQDEEKRRSLDFNAAGRFLRSKLEPWAGSIWDIIAGQNYEMQAVGPRAKPGTPGYEHRYLNMFKGLLPVPLGVQGVFEAIQGDPEQGIMPVSNPWYLFEMVGAEFLGMGAKSMPVNAKLAAEVDRGYTKNAEKLANLIQKRREVLRDPKLDKYIKAVREKELQRKIDALRGL